MKIIHSVLHHKITTLIFIISYVVIFPMTVVYVLGAVFNQGTIESHSDWYWILTFSTLFSVPFMVVFLTEDEEGLARWQSMSLDFVYGFTLFALVNSSILWFVYPEYSRLEPLTVLLGFIAGWTTYSRNRNQNKITLKKEITESEMPLS
ncbi:MAG: hypothetical protein Phog2KO_01050 [Phototrophicaceae bacterium]